MPMLQWGMLLLPLSQLLLLQLPVNPPASVVAPVAADTAFANTFDFAILIATYTGPDVAIVGNIIVQNNPTFSAASSASEALTIQT